MFTGGEFCCSFMYACGATILSNIFNSCCCCCDVNAGPYQQWKKFDEYFEAKNLEGQIAIVTGANTGIGKETAFKLAKQGATVILACRNIESGRVEADKINNALPTVQEKGASMKARAIAMQLDLSNFRSIDAFCTEFKAKFSHLDILVNNAGSNQDGFLEDLQLQTLFQVNYLGHFYLFHELLDLLRAKQLNSENETASRVINLSSVMHHIGQTDFEKSSLNQYTKEMQQQFSYYSDTKLYMNFLTSYINSTYSGYHEDFRKVMAISVNPGAVKSTIWRHLPCKWLFDMIMSCFFLDVQDGAKASLFACTVDEKAVQQYQDEHGENKSKAGKLLFRPDIPYITPYNSTGFLYQEIMGSFANPDFRPCSFPSGAVPDEAFDVTPMINCSMEMCKKLNCANIAGKNEQSSTDDDSEKGL